MSAKLLRSGESHADAPSDEAILATANFSQKAFRRRTLDSLLEEQRLQAALDEWEEWQKVSPFGGKANR